MLRAEAGGAGLAAAEAERARLEAEAAAGRRTQEEQMTSMRQQVRPARPAPRGCTGRQRAAAGGDEGLCVCLLLLLRGLGGSA